MSGTGLAVFDKTVQETSLWLAAIAQRMNINDRHLAYVVLRATLHALRDRLGPQNAVHLGAQLPLLIRGVYYEGWHMAGTPTKERHKEDFLKHIAREFGGRFDLDPDTAARAVFDTIWEHIELGEVAKIQKILPEDLRDLWRSSAPSPGLT